MHRPDKGNPLHAGQKILLLVLLVLFLLIIARIFTIRLIRRTNMGNTRPSGSTAPAPTTQSGKQPKGIYCPRITPYPNPQEINNAIKLVVDNLGEKLGANQTDNRTNNWLNCINAQYKDLPAGVEGVFVFDANSAVDNLQIFVDIGYKQYDDLLRAMLLSHELRHVLQYLEYVGTGKEPDCIEAEVEAFQTQYFFFASLSENEKISLRDSTKKHLTDEPYVPLVSMYETYVSARQACGKTGTMCIRNTITQSLRDSITNNPYYQQQCGL